MDFKGIPSYANDYEFIVCYKGELDDPDTYYFYSISDNAHMAEKDCEEIRNSGLEPIIIHNVRIQGVRR